MIDPPAGEPATRLLRGRLPRLLGVADGSSVIADGLALSAHRGPLPARFDLLWLCEKQCVASIAVLSRVK